MIGKMRCPLQKMSAIILLSCLVVTCSSQLRRNVGDFKFATWNSHGAKWNAVSTLMKEGKLDVLTIQEAGSLPPPQKNPTDKPDEIGFIIPEHNGNGDVTDVRGIVMPDQHFIGHARGNGDQSLFVNEFTWDTKWGRFYINYWDRKTHEQMKIPDEKTKSSQNLAIVTKEKAERSFILSPLDAIKGEEMKLKQGDPKTKRDDINRATIGVQISNAVFFNVHAQPNGDLNEAHHIVNRIQEYMALPRHPDGVSTNGLTWAITGDFNREPSTLLGSAKRTRGGTPKKLVNQPPNTFREIVSSGKNTHICTKSSTKNTPRTPSDGQDAELDYGIIGGPANLKQSITAAVYSPLAFQEAQRAPRKNKPDAGVPSDHVPVKFN